MGTRKSPAKPARSPKTSATPSPPPGPASWAVLIYLAGDLGALAESVRHDLGEILAVGATKEVAIAIQYDGPEGGARYLPPQKPASGMKPTQVLGRIDSGSATVLGDFLRWGLRVCPAQRIALVLGGLSALDPYREEGEDGKIQSRVFTICRDDTSGGHLDVVELGTVIREVLAEQGRDQLEMLAVDSCHMQFLELAYELEGRVQVLLSSQTLVPESGWNYTAILKVWQTVVRDANGVLNSNELARLLVPPVLESYRQGNPRELCAVSALDLRRLDDVARAFDTLCISMMQALGEGLIWEARRMLVSMFDDACQPNRHPAYDSGSFFKLLGTALDGVADEACQRWLCMTLQRAYGPMFTRFREAVADHLRSRLDASADPVRLQGVIDALMASDFAARGRKLLAEIEAALRERICLLSPNRIGTVDWKGVEGQARSRDGELEEAIRSSFRMLPAERQFDFHRLKDSVGTARRLAKQTRQALATLLGEGADPGGETGIGGDSSVREGMVLAAAMTNGLALGWPRWSGVSLYRPPKLDELMNASYQRFAFHRRVHWAALLGAANLILDHPRALWRLVSSLLATGGPGTRRDLLRRLTGPDSVIFGLREQFQVMAPAPTLTLSLERRQGSRSGEMMPGDDGEVHREYYLLRLESANRGAVITEQLSRVQPRVMDRALHELEELLSTSSVSIDSFHQLRALGGLLGEDIFQALGHTIEEERKAALSETPGSAVHLQLQIPRELMAYPWELLHHEGEWLSERFAMGRQVFMETGLARRVPRRRQGRVRPLIIGDPIFDAGLGWPQLPGARDEAEQVAGWFDRLREELGDVIDFHRETDTRIHTRLTNAEFRALLRDGEYDIIHFAGHGVFNPKDPETSAWLLSDGELWALEIRNTLSAHPAPPWLVYANACESGMETRRPRYQGNVFGLATAFINQGVAAYVAPLWPIDDLLAQQIALDFYHQLLAERTTLGEALRQAKSQAHAIATPSSVSGEDGNTTWASLGWASLVLYGDPTEELFQALAGTEGRRGNAAPSQIERYPSNPPPAPPPPPRVAVAGVRPYLHAPDHVLMEWVDAPRTLRKAQNRGAMAGSGGIGPALELVEEAGLRRWRVRRPGDGIGQRGAVSTGTDGLPGSDFAQLLADDRIRRQLPGRRGAVRVIGRWVLGGFEEGLTGLVREYDRDQVEDEGLLLVSDRGLEPLTRDNLPPVQRMGATDRILLLIHGTFSKTQSPVDGFGPGFLAWARQRYRAVLGLDHWTLSKSPLENAQALQDQLRALAPEYLEGRRLDVITHSRGGLVARSFSELLGNAGAVRNLIFMGTPNCGTDLANPKNWGAMADALVNMTGLDHAETLGRIAGLLARLAVGSGEEKLPGLLAQNPLMAGVSGSFLQRLQQPNAGAGGVRHAIVTAEFEPAPMIPNLKGLWQAARQAGINTAVDRFFQDANDLVVNTAHVWCVEQSSDDRANLPAFIPAGRVLALVSPNSTLVLPAGVAREVVQGVHHCNLFRQAKAQQAIKDWLGEGPERAVA